MVVVVKLAFYPFVLGAFTCIRSIVVVVVV